MGNTAASRQFVRFIVVGLYNTAVGYALFAALAIAYGDRLHHQVILALSFCLSVVNAYASQRILVFKSRGRIVDEFPRFVAVNLSALLVNAVLLEGLVRMSFALLWAQLIATLATTVISFVAHQAWSFRIRP